MRQVVFLIQTADRKGLLAEISSFFYNSGFNILQCRQFSDIRAGRYFMRIALELNAEITRRELEEAFARFAGKLELEYSVHHLEAKQNVALMVSKASLASSVPFVFVFVIILAVSTAGICEL